MKQLSLHPHLDTLFALWAPPHEAARALAQPITDAFLDCVFIAEAVRNAPPVRIVKTGAALYGVFGHTDRDLFSRFNAPDRILLWGLLNSVSAQGRPGLVRIKAGLAAGAQINVDLALAPLGGVAGASRWLGFYQASGNLSAGGAIQSHEILSVHPPKPDRKLNPSNP